MSHACLQARKKIEELHSNDEKLYVCSMSSQTIVYKGLMLPNAISDFYKDIIQKIIYGQNMSYFIKDFLQILNQGGI